MVDNGYKDLFYKRNTTKKLKIESDDGLFTAKSHDIQWENFELTESLCVDSELRFGSCEPSMVKFQILNAFIPLIGKGLTVTETISGNTNAPFQYGKYKVFSDVPTADKEYRDIVAYDSLYDIISADVAEWYNTVLPDKDSTKTMKQFRESFIGHFGLAEVVPEGGLVNDNMIVEKTIEPSELSGKTVIESICEINGCFGHIGRDGKFHYIYLQQEIQGLYPADFLYPDHVPEQWNHLSQAETGHLYPQDPKGEKIGKNRYIKCQYEDYFVRSIRKLQIRMEENDIGMIYGDGENCYVIQDNFLVYGKSSADLEVIAENIYNKIRGVVYRPFSAECPGNPCLEVGDPVRLQTKHQIVESYIFKRTFKGIQAPRDSYSSEGLERRSEEVNSAHQSIIQMKGKANVLTRTIEETKIEMYDIEAGLNSKITVTASEIRTEVSNSDQNLQSQITQNAGEIALRVTKDGVVSAINLSPETITIKANKIDLQGLVNADELVSKFATIATLNATKAELETLIAKRATISQLEASNARITSLEVDHVSVNEFNAAKARIDTIESTYITASKVKADYMEVANWTSAGLIKADKINVDDLFANRAVNKDLHVKGFFLGNNYFSMNNKNIGFVTVSINSKSYRLLGEIE